MSCVRGSLFLSLLCIFVSLASSAQSDTVAQHEQRAQEYLRSQQPALARKELEAVIAADPGKLNAQANLGVLLYFAGDFVAAEPHLRTAMALPAGTAKLQALLGFCEYRSGERVRARGDLEAALPRLTDLKVRKEAGLELVELDTAAGDLTAAAAAVALLKVAEPTDPEVLYAAYRVYTDLAGEAMLSLSVSAPASAQMHQAMSHELLRERDNAGAIANLRAALKTDPHLPGGHFELGEALQASDQPAQKAEAQSQFRLAVEENPKDDKAFARLGDAEADKGEHEAAMTAYRQAIAIQPENADAAIGLAHELNETGHTDEAIGLLQGVVKADPENMLAHYRLSALYRRAHRPEDAKREVAEYERIKALHSQLQVIYKELRMDSPQADDHAKP